MLGLYGLSLPNAMIHASCSRLLMKQFDSSKIYPKQMHFFNNQKPKYEPRHEISNDVVHVNATSKGSDQPAHKHSLIRAFASV